MIINYKPQEQELEIGRPYTLTGGKVWYMRVNEDAVIRLSSNDKATTSVLCGSMSSAHIRYATTWTGFCYATSMEIK